MNFLRLAENYVIAHMLIAGGRSMISVIGPWEWNQA